MSYRIEITPAAQRQIRRLDPQVGRRIRTFLSERLAALDDPRQVGQALRSQERLWRYRVGDHRIIAQIQDERVVVLVVEIGHRREVYRR